MRSSRREGDFAGGERKHTAPAGEHGDVLFTIDGIRDGSRDHTALGVGGPEFLAGVGAIGFEIALRGAFEDKISRGGEKAAVHGARAIDAPDFFLLRGIPSGKMALDGSEDGFLDLRFLRQARGNEIDPGVECQIAVLGMLVRFVEESRVLDGDIG